MPSATTTDTLHNAWMKFLLHNNTTDINTVLPDPGASQTFWIGLYITAPAVSGSGGVEVSGGSYVRQPISRALGANGWTATGSGSNLEYSNTTEITFPIPTANWGTVTAGGIFNSQAAGTLLYIATLGSSKQINNGDGAPKILANQFRIARAYC